MTDLTKQAISSYINKVINDNSDGIASYLSIGTETPVESKELFAKNGV